MIKVYDRNMRTLAVLENAYAISYEKTLNEIDSASFSLPLDDPKNAHCTPFNFVELYENGERIDLFRIMPTETVKNESTNRITYECEHVLATLIDDVIFGYFQRTNYTTREVLTDLLAYQTTQNWRLGNVDFTRYFHYGAEHENVLSVLFSVPKPFDVAYQWTWDTSVYPWVLNLTQAPDEVVGETRWGKNVRGFTKYSDPKPLCTRIYPLGYGEGVNQLDIREVNPTGLPYIEADTVGEYGIINYVWPDRRYEYADALFAAGKAKLEELKRPLVTYEVDAVDLRQLGHLDRFDVGKLVRIHDVDLGVVDVRVMRFTRPDSTGEPWAIQLEIGNKRDNLAVSNVDLARRQQINDTYSQGTTNRDSHSYVDNCDPQHPAKIRLFLDEGLVNINSMKLTYEIEPFRAYSRAIEGGGAIVDSTEAGGASTQTSSSGGGTTATSSSGGGTTATSSSGGGVSTSTASGGGSSQTSSSGGGTSRSTSSGGGTTTTSTSAGAHRHVMFQTTGNAPSSQFAMAASTAGGGTIYLDGNTSGMTNFETLSAADSHSHSVSIPNHTHEFSTPDHTHSVNIPSHTHDFNVPNHSHNVTIPNHTHDVTIPNHTHTVNIPAHIHEIRLPDHVHEIEHGIFVLNRQPSAVEIRVDGNLVPSNDTVGREIDIIPYLAKDSSGKVSRGAFHEVTITPNDLGRVSADVISRLFIQSREGGIY